MSFELSPYSQTPSLSYDDEKKKKKKTSKKSTSGSDSAGTSSGIQLTRDADLLIRSYLPPVPIPSPGDSSDKRRLPEDTSESLSLPFCLPQISVNSRFDSAFARGYNEVLESVGISQETMLNFIDGLNLAIVASPPLRVVDYAGMVIGFVPYHWAIIASVIIQTAAQTSMHVLSKTLTDRYLRSANLNLFQPLGLSVRLCTTRAMLLLLTNSTSPNSKSTTKEKLNKVGRGVGSVLLRLPIPFAGRIVRAIADKPPSVPPTGYFSTDPIDSPVVGRRFAMTENLALPVETHGLPEPEKPQGVMDVVNSWGVKLDNAREGRKEKKNEERRRALMRMYQAGVLGEEVDGMGGRPLPVPMPSSSSTSTNGTSATKKTNSTSSVKNVASQALSAWDAHRMRKEVWKEGRAQRRAAFQRDLDEKFGKVTGIKGLLGPSQTLMERRVASADLLEHWASDKVLWVVVMKVDKDSEIEGIELAENLRDEEYIEESAWKAQMKLEKEDLEDEIASEEEWEEKEKQVKPSSPKV